VVVLALLLTFFLVKVGDCLHLISTFLLRQYEFMNEPFLSNHDALLVNDVVELAIILF